MNFIEILSLMIALVHLRVNCVATTVPTTCDERQFQCDAGECVPMIKLCNGVKDCDDYSDETKCRSENYPKCNKGYFQCVSDRRCIPLSWKCDEDEDCADESDEENCAGTTYCDELDEFYCPLNGYCIQKELRCDGKIDCGDGFDEQNCGPSRNCVLGDLPCEDGHNCYAREWLCDGEKDCDDGSDEKQCDNAPLESTTSDSPTPATEILESSKESCPEDYCVQNADCVVIEGQYYCNCAPSFTGKMCEMRLTAERTFHDLGVVIGIAMTLIILFILIALVFLFYYKKRTARNSTSLISKNESQMPFTSYSKE